MPSPHMFSVKQYRDLLLGLIDNKSQAWHQHFDAQIAPIIKNNNNNNK